MPCHATARLVQRIVQTVTKRPCRGGLQVFSRIRLPPEVLLMIFDCLPLEAKASLSLCDRSLYDFGKRHHVFGDLRLNAVARQKFLEIYRLDYIHPYYVACGDCNSPHKVIHYSIDRSSRIKRKNEDRDCWTRERSERSLLYFHAKFSFGDV